MKCILRREGPRDGGDMLLSLRVPPTAWFSDNANLFAKHVNKRHRDHFNPNQGRICDKSDDNIAAAKAGSLSISMPYLDAKRTEFKQPDLKSLEDGIHPITKVADRFCFSDEFHKRNLCDEQDRLLRSFKHVPELNASLSTVGHEQLFAKFDKNKHFLNKFHSSVHMLLMRLIFNDHNEKANRNLFEKMDSRIKMTTTLDEHMDHVRSFGFVSHPIHPILLSDSDDSTNEKPNIKEQGSQAEMSPSLEDIPDTLFDETLPQDKIGDIHLDTEGDGGDVHMDTRGDGGDVHMDIEGDGGDVHMDTRGDGGDVHMDTKGDIAISDDSNPTEDVTLVSSITDERVNHVSVGHAAALSNFTIQIPPQSARNNQNDCLESATTWAGYSLQNETRLKLHHRSCQTNEKHRRQIHLHEGDILNIRCDAIVNAANCSLKKGGGIDKQIQDRGGPEMQKELEQYHGGCDTGQCVVTRGHGIQHVRYVLHAVGPDLRKGKKRKPSTRQRNELKSCCVACLRTADSLQLKSVAFCCISSRIYGYPKRESAEIAIKTVLQYLRDTQCETKIIFVTSGEMTKFYETALSELLPGHPALLSSRAPVWQGRYLGTHLTNTCTIDNVFFIVYYVFESFPHIKRKLKACQENNTRTLCTLLENVRKADWDAVRYTWGKQVLKTDVRNKVMDFWGSEMEKIVDVVNFGLVVDEVYERCSSCNQLPSPKHLKAIHLYVNEDAAENNLSIQELLELWSSDRVDMCNRSEGCKKTRRVSVISCESNVKQETKVCGGEIRVKRIANSAPCILVMILASPNIRIAASEKRLNINECITFQGLSYELVAVTRNHDVHFFVLSSATGFGIVTMVCQPRQSRH